MRDLDKKSKREILWECSTQVKFLRHLYPSQIKIKLYFSLGRLAANNKKFDSCLSGAPFKFKLGKGEVIKGWDLGLLGIKVGGKRRLTIPPKLAYGQNGAPPDIPPNSTLIFEIECKFAK